MFGTLKPHRCHLDHDTRLVHNRFYCGLCKGLGAGYGTLSRALVSHDAVFVALVVDALIDERAADDSCRCPLLPLVHRPTVAPDSTAMRFAAAVQVLLADQWLADRATEGKTLARVARPLASRYVADAERTLAAMGVDVAPLRGFELRQARQEAVAQSPEDAAEPTMDALAYVFEQIAVLVPVLRNEAHRGALRALGRAIGGAIYWADALDDLEQDYLGEAFNPCVVRHRWRLGMQGAMQIAPERVERCVVLLREALAQMQEQLDRLPWVRHQALLESVLCDAFPRVARRVIAKARQVTEDKKLQELERWRAMPWYGRLLQRVVLAFSLMLAWLTLSKQGYAQQGRPATSTKAKADAGAPAPGAVEPESSTGKPGAASKPKKSKRKRPNLIADPSSDDDEPEGSDLGGPGDGDKADKGGSGGGGAGSCDVCNPKGCCDKCCNDTCGQCCKQPCAKCGDGCGDICKCNDCCGNCCKSSNCCNDCCKA